MNISKIAAQLNDLAITNNCDIANLPELRKKHLGKSRLPGTIFTNRTVFNGADIYAFHYGGRDEMQFNIGSEVLNGKEVTRVALCFSLEPSQSLPDPVKVLLPYKNKFNNFIKNQFPFFKEFEMWHFQNGKKNGNYKPKEISDSVFKRHTFIALGKHINKPLHKLDDSDLIKILEIFDKLLPLYKYCVLSIPLQKPIENKITRICFNKEGWVKPSGMEGKSKLKKSYEYKTGFGHEEWLFDFDKLIDGNHYGFLQAIGEVAKHVGNIYNISLFTINADTKERSWVATINNALVIDKKEKEKIYNEYSRKKWLTQMHNDLKIHEIDKRIIDGKKLDLNKEINSSTFNIKFKPEDVSFILKPFVEEDFQQVKAEYYKLYESDYIYINEADSEIKVQKPNSPPEFPPANNARVSKPRSIELSQIHYFVAKGLYESLIKVFGKNKTFWEYSLPYGGRVDIAVNSDNGWIYYEVKSYVDLRTSIRDALGQLLEYAHWQGKDNASELVIVTQKVKGLDFAKFYLKHLREKYGIKIFYQFFDLSTNKLSEKY